MQKVSNYLNAKDTKLFIGLTALALMLMFQMDFASAADWTTTVETEVKSAGDEVMGVMLKILVVGLGIFALQFGVRKAMKFFKSTTN